MDGNTLKIRNRLVGTVRIVRNDPFRRVRPEHSVRVGRNAFEFDVGSRECADVAAGAGKRHPRRWRDFAVFICHLGVTVGGRRSPIEERALEADRSIGSEIAIAVGDCPTEPLAIEAGQGRHDVLRKPG
jgi:hypothetical protein